MNEINSNRKQTFAPSVVISGMSPAVDSGRHPVKRVVNQALDVEVDVFKDGHDLIDVALLWRKAGEETWNEVKMRPSENDRWAASVHFETPGRYEYSVAGWPELFETWKVEFIKKYDARQEDLSVEIAEAALLVRGAARRARRGGDDEVAKELVRMAELLPTLSVTDVRELLCAESVGSVMNTWADRDLMTI